MLVDDAVVVIENIERHLKELGKPVKIAVIEGTQEVIFPVLAGTIATTVVLIPLLFVGDYPERIFRPLAETLIIAVIVSYFVSITVIPLVAPYILRKDNQLNSMEKLTFNLMEKVLNLLKRFYVNLAENLIENKFFSLLFFLFFLFLFVLSVRLILPVVGREIMPPMDTGIVKVHITFDSNLPVEKVENLTEKISEIIISDKRVEMFGLSVGSEAGVLTVSSGGGINTLSATIHYTDRFHRKETIWDIEKDLREKLWKLPGIKYLHVYDYGATPLSSIKGNLDVRISGDDLKILDQIGEQMLNLCYQVKGITSLSRTWDYDKTVYYLKIKQDRALYYGITPYEIGVQLASKIRGGYVSFVNVSNEESIKVRVIYTDSFRQSIKDIKSYYITTKKGKIPLTAVAYIEKHVEPSQITRQNLQYTLDILGYREKAAITHIVENFKQLYRNSSISLPAGYAISNEGDIKQLNDSMRRMFIAIITGIIFLYLALVPAFRSFLSPLSVIMAIPLSVIGAAWSVLIMGYHQSMPGLMGIVLLSGIITKNSILLIEFIQRSIEKGKDLKGSIIDSIQIRTRPVLMTAFATSVGMIPVAFGWALGLERLSPLGTVAIGGLIVGTFLTLIYVPCFCFWKTKNAAKEADYKKQGSDAQ
ncbi:MAG: efflux RND transporter permease subunit [Persephonella sp.]|nr:efflux RND transporter permease subunit [Persephonella sp.]